MSEKQHFPIRFGIVGMGHIGRRHAAMIGQNPHSKLVSVADINPEVQPSLDLPPSVVFYPDLDALLAAESKPDVVNICTPNYLHGPQAIQIIQAGCHVVIEKPMCLTKQEGEAIIHEALQSGKLAFCVMQNRYSPPSVWLKSIVDQGILGNIYHVQINCFWNRDARYYKPGGWKGVKKMDGGTLFTQFSHFVDMMYWLFGDITQIHSRLYNFNHKELTEFEDSGIAQFEFVRGGTGSFSFSTSVWDQNLESSMTIIAENGSVKVGGQYMNQVEYCHIKNYQMPALAESSPANDYGHYKGSAANHHFVIENVVEALSGKTSATTNAMEGLKVVEIIERLYQNQR